MWDLKPGVSDFPLFQVISRGSFIQDRTFHIEVDQWKQGGRAAGISYLIADNSYILLGFSHNLRQVILVIKKARDT